MGQPLPAAAIRKELSEACARYRDQEERGGDMVQAGQELARVVGDLASGPICGMPREWVLREMRPRLDAADEQTDVADEQTDVPPDDYGYKDYR